MLQQPEPPATSMSKASPSQKAAPLLFASSNIRHFDPERRC